MPEFNLYDYLEEITLANLRANIAWLNDGQPLPPPSRRTVLRYRIERVVERARHAIANRICRHEDYCCCG